MKKDLLFILIACFTTICLQAQDYGGFVYGVKGGLSVGTQKWNNFDKEPLFSYQGAIYIESLPADKKFSLFAQTGYHVRGSAVRNIIITNNGDQTRDTRTMNFNNVSLAAGAKQRYEVKPSTFVYYMLGLRGEYTLSSNLCSYQEVEENGYFSNGKTCPIGAFDNFIQKWNYGMILGGGVEFELAERFGFLVELSLNPDISYQYRQPQGVRRINFTGNPSNNTTYNEQLVRNTTLELSVGIRLLRLVEYID